MPWLIALALLVVPIAEIYVIIQVGQVIGGWPTIGLLLVESALGAWIVKREGRRAWTALQTALNSGKMPGRELTDGALVLVGGTLLLTPGFLTDIFGFIFVLPFTRPLARRAVTKLLSRRAARLAPTTFAPFMPGSTQPRRPQNDPVPGDVVQGEVIDPDQSK
jgi:UPF0716 protein FxsA